jgi:hypothetical protein
MKRETWLAVDGHGDERAFSVEPYRKFPNMNLEVQWGQRWDTGALETDFRYGVLLPKGTIKYLTGKDLTYSDEPIKII